jgi:hypothetical protein
MPKERRRFPRVSSEFPLRYRQIPVVKPGYHDAWVEDVSVAGVRFRCSDDVRVRSSMLFELLIPGAKPVHTFGRVAWVARLPDREGFEIGGTFEEQSTTTLKAIQQHLQREHAHVGA